MHAMQTAQHRPGVTDAHRAAAFQAMAWTGWTYEQAMADPVRSRIVQLRARQLCNAEARRMRRPILTDFPPRRQPPGLHTTRVLQTDCKRAAAGDRDD